MQNYQWTYGEAEIVGFKVDNEELSDAIGYGPLEKDSRFGELAAAYTKAEALLLDYIEQQLEVHGLELGAN